MKLTVTINLSERAREELAAIGMAIVDAKVGVEMPYHDGNYDIGTAKVLSLLGIDVLECHDESDNSKEILHPDTPC